MQARAKFKWLKAAVRQERDAKKAPLGRGLAFYLSDIAASLTIQPALTIIFVENTSIASHRL